MLPLLICNDNRIFPPGWLRLKMKYFSVTLVKMQSIITKFKYDKNDPDGIYYQLFQAC